MKNTFKKLGTTSIVAMALASAGASADMLDFLHFDQNVGWDEANSGLSPAAINRNFTLEFRDPTSPPAPAGTDALMAWSGPNNNNESSVRVQGFDTAGDNNSPSASMPPDDNGLWNMGEAWIITELFQENEVLAAGGWPNPLWTADVAANLIVSTTPGGDNLLAPADAQNSTTIEFWETFNVRTGNADDCGSPNPLETACDDIYRIALDELAPVSFDLDDYRYTMVFGLLPGPSTPGPATTLVCGVGDCEGIDVTPGELWVFTPEENPGTSSLFVTMEWFAERINVPEPGVLALFGMGIMGAGLASRRRRKA